MSRLLLLAAALFFGSLTFSSARADEASAQAFIKELADRVMEVLKDKSASTADKSTRLQQVFEGHVDIAWVGQFVLGKHWKTASEQQKQAYLANYKAFVINSYSKRLEDYTGETYKILSTKPSGEGRYLIAMQIDRPNNQPVKVDYRLRDVNGTYQVYDLIVEGVSLIQTQRSEFDSVVQRNGLDYLIKQLGNRAANPNAKPPV